MDIPAQTRNETEQFLTDILSSSAILVWQTDPQTRFTFLNRTWETVLGYSPEEMAGRQFADFQEPGSLPFKGQSADISSFLKTIEPGSEKKYEGVFSGRAGDRIILVIHAKKIMDDTNRITGMRGIASVVRVSTAGMTLYKNIQDYYTEVIESTDTGFVMITEDGIVELANNNYLRLTGRTSSNEIIGHSVLEWTAPYDIDRNRYEVTQCIENGCTNFLEIDYQYPDKTIIHIEIIANTVETPEGKRIITLCRDVSERKRLTDSIREREALLKQSQRIARIGHYIMDVSSGKWKVSEMFYDIHGIEKDFPLSTENLAELVHPEDRADTYNQLMTGAVKNKIPFEKDYRIIRASDNEIRWLRGIGNIEFDEQGNTRNIFGTVQDITERKNAAAELEQSEDRFRKIFREGQFGIAISGKDLKFVTANPAFCRMLGYSEEELSGMTFREITHPDNLNIDAENVTAVFTGKLERYATEKRYIKKNGDVIWGSLVGSMIRDKEGKLTYFLAMVQDITERKAAEEALAQEKERLRVTLRSIGDGVITTDKNGCILTINKAAEYLTGWPQEDAAGKPLDQVFHIIDESTGTDSINPATTVLSTGTKNELANHTILIARDGTSRTIADSGAPIRNEKGDTIGVVLVFRDITEEQKLMDNVQKMQKLESLGVLAGGIAHDFNNLLSGIYGNIELARILSRDTQVKDHLNMSLSTINRARGLTQQLLTFAKGGVPILKTQNPGRLVTETVRFALSGSNITCNFNIQEDLWLCDIDTNQIGQAIENITINAVQAMPLGGTITVQCTNTMISEKEYPFLKPGRFVQISIRDQGIGIPKDIQSRIFDPFFTTKQQGSGLGLTTSYSIIRRHSGFIEVESDPGTGSLFRILIPAAEEKKTDPPKKEDPIRRGSGKILVMDDEEVIRTTLSHMLALLGYTAIVTEEGGETLRVFEKEKTGGGEFKAVILDLTVHGGMGGIETITKLRKLDPAVPVFVSSGYAEDPAVSYPEKYGFTGSIKKPYTLNDISILLELISEKPS